MAYYVLRLESILAADVPAEGEVLRTAIRAEWGHGLVAAVGSALGGEVVVVCETDAEYFRLSYMAPARPRPVFGQWEKVAFPAGSLSAVVVETGAWESGFWAVAPRMKRLAAALHPAGLVMFEGPASLIARVAPAVAEHLHPVAAIRYETLANRILVVGRVRHGDGERGQDVAAALTAFARGRAPTLLAPEGRLRLPAVPAGPAVIGNAFDPQGALQCAEGAAAELEGLREVLLPRYQERMETLAPLRQGHLAQLLAGGLLNGIVVETKAGERLLVKGLVRRKLLNSETGEEFADAPLKAGERESVWVEVLASEAHAVDLASGRYVIFTQGEEP